LYIQNGNRLAAGHGQIQLQGFLHLSLLTLGDIGSDGLCGTLNGFGRHLQAGQELQLLAAAVEGGFLAYQSLHAVHPGRKLRVGDVQFHVDWKVAGMASGTQVVGTGDTYRTYDRQDGFAADFLVGGLMATAARQLTLIGRRGWELQQFC
jgi:hypothetical protein